MKKCKICGRKLYFNKCICIDCSRFSLSRNGKTKIKKILKEIKDMNKHKVEFNTQVVVIAVRLQTLIKMR